MADIQSAAASTSSQAVPSGGQASSVESVATERRAAADSVVERAEPEPAAPGPGVGEQVDIQA